MSRWIAGPATPPAAPDRTAPLDLVPKGMAHARITSTQARRRGGGPPPARRHGVVPPLRAGLGGYGNDGLAERPVRGRHSQRRAAVRRRAGPAQHRCHPVHAPGQRHAGRRGLGRRWLHRPAQPHRHVSRPEVTWPGADSRAEPADRRGGLLRVPRPVRRDAARVRRWHDADRLRPRGHRATGRRRHRGRPQQHPDRAGQAVDWPLAGGQRVRRGGGAGRDLGGQQRRRRLRPDVRIPGGGDRRRPQRGRRHAQLHHRPGHLPTQHRRLVPGHRGRADMDRRRRARHRELGHQRGHDQVLRHDPCREPVQLLPGPPGLYPSGYWFWNLRMQVQANLSAGEFALNDPVYWLYTSNLSNIQAWTNSKMPGHQGICVPETMRFNGNGTYNGGTDNDSCDSTIAPTWNSLTITSGAEIALWIWQQYLMTDDTSFLSTNYPIISGAARFLLSSASTGSDGLLHTRANAHETQWNVT